VNQRRNDVTIILLVQSRNLMVVVQRLPSRIAHAKAIDVNGGVGPLKGRRCSIIQWSQRCNSVTAAVGSNANHTGVVVVGLWAQRLFHGGAQNRASVVRQIGVAKQSLSEHAECASLRVVGVVVVGIVLVETHTRCKEWIGRSCPWPHWCTVGLGCQQTRLRIGQRLVVDHEWHNWNGPMRTSHCITDNLGSTDHWTNQYDKMTLTFPRQLPKKSDQALQVHSKMDSLIRTRFLKNYPKPYRGIATVLLQPTSGTPIRVAVESRLRRSLHNRNVLRQWRAKRYWRDPI
jgi:hypothetical protein